MLQEHWQTQCKYMYILCLSIGTNYLMHVLQYLYNPGSIDLHSHTYNDDHMYLKVDNSANR